MRLKAQPRCLEDIRSNPNSQPDMNLKPDNSLNINVIDTGRGKIETFVASESLLHFELETGLNPFPDLGIIPCVNDQQNNLDSNPSHNQQDDGDINLTWSKDSNSYFYSDPNSQSSSDDFLPLSLPSLRPSQSAVSSVDILEECEKHLSKNSVTLIESKSLASIEEVGKHYKNPNFNNKNATDKQDREEQLEGELSNPSFEANLNPNQVIDEETECNNFFMGDDEASDEVTGEVNGEGNGELAQFYHLNSMFVKEGRLSLDSCSDSVETVVCDRRASRSSLCSLDPSVFCEGVVSERFEIKREEMPICTILCTFLGDNLLNGTLDKDIFDLFEADKDISETDMDICKTSKDTKIDADNAIEMETETETETYFEILTDTDCDLIKVDNKVDINLIVTEMDSVIIPNSYPNPSLNRIGDCFPVEKAEYNPPSDHTSNPNNEPNIEIQLESLAGDQAVVPLHVGYKIQLPLEFNDNTECPSLPTPTMFNPMSHPMSDAMANTIADHRQMKSGGGREESLELINDTTATNPNPNDMLNNSANTMDSDMAYANSRPNPQENDTDKVILDEAVVKLSKDNPDTSPAIKPDPNTVSNFIPNTSIDSKPNPNPSIDFIPNFHDYSMIDSLKLIDQATAANALQIAYKTISERHYSSLSSSLLSLPPLSLSSSLSLSSHPNTNSNTDPKLLSSGAGFPIILLSLVNVFYGCPSQDSQNGEIQSLFSLASALAAFIPYLSTSEAEDVDTTSNTASKESSTVSKIPRTTSNGPYPPKRSSSKVPNTASKVLNTTSNIASLSSLDDNLCDSKRKRKVSHLIMNTATCTIVMG
jgi:hypothetical protein